MAQTAKRRMALLGAGVITLFGLMFGAQRLMGPLHKTERGANMNDVRTVVRVLQSRSTIEGAGVHLNRVFGFGVDVVLDPFLLMDHFGSDNPDDYMAGFPWHPHRGMETITYVLSGEVTHEDSLGNKDTISSGDVQWMTAGSGIVHQEMPRGDAAHRMNGIQLWANLPKDKKMTPPQYRGIESSQIPQVELENGGRVRIIAGEFKGHKGAVGDGAIRPEYFDISLPEQADFRHFTPHDHTVFIYVLAGDVFIGTGQAQTQVSVEYLAHLSKGEAVQIRAEHSARFLLVSGRPLREPVAWRGPIVMNTEAELEAAFKEIRDGTFIR